MSPLKKIGLVAGLATLGKSSNLHKSKVAATDQTTELRFNEFAYTDVQYLFLCNFDKRKSDLRSI